jgi:plasmid stabilization system protein ParE
MNVVFGPFADLEYEEAFDYYEAEEPGLGEKFRRAVWAAIAIVEQHPQIGQEVRPGVRKVLVRRFPYKLIYSVRGDTLRIIAVAHGHRKPDYWVDRA